MSEHTAEKDALAQAVEKARVELTETPWWQPFKRQRLGREYRYALLFAALAGVEPDRVLPPGQEAPDA